MQGIKLFTGNSNPSVAAAVANHLGIEPGKAYVGTFSDGEVRVEFDGTPIARDGLLQLALGEALEGVAVHGSGFGHAGSILVGSCRSEPSKPESATPGSIC